MSSYIADRYAGILTKEDICQLFDMLVTKRQDNRSKAARECGLTAKTTYDWAKAKYIKSNNKRKVLGACLKADFANTVDYLLARSSERTVDVLRTLLSTIFAEAIQTDSRTQFVTSVEKFYALRRKYGGLIRDQMQDEVSDMMRELREKGPELDVRTPKTMEEISTEELLDIIPMMGEAYLSSPKRAHNLIETLDLPRKFNEVLLSTLEKMRPKVALTKASETERTLADYRTFGAILKQMFECYSRRTPTEYILPNISNWIKPAIERFQRGPEISSGLGHWLVFESEESAFSSVFERRIPKHEHGGWSPDWISREI